MTKPTRVNRTAVVLLPEEGYLEWTRTCPGADPDMTLDRLRSEATAYLLPEPEVERDKHLRRHFKPMLHEELFAWCRDETYWPRDLSFRTFRKFFDVQVASMVFDLAKSPLVREDGGE